MKKLSIVLLGSVSVAAFSAPAFAQTAPAGSKAEDASTAADTPPDAGEVVVTGSRTIKNGDASPSPVTVVATDDLQKVQPGATLADALNTLPAFAGSRGSSSNPTTIGSAAGGNGSANQLNLRNLGATRTLVLMDGKRVPPTLFNGVVDVDIIPEALVERVDIVTGGVSAVYGSDAISGVVNYVINRKLQGVRADGSYGITEEGDAGRINASVAYGTNIGDRGHVEFSYEYRKEDGIDRRTDRAWLNQVGVTGAGTAANPYNLQTNLRQAGFPFGGLITTGALAGQNFKTNGVLSAFVPGTATGTAAIQIGGDGGYWDSSLLSSLKSHQGFARFDYEVSDNVRFYAQASGNFKNNTNKAETAQLNQVFISRTNAFLSPAIQALIPVAQPTFRLSKFLAEIPRAEADADSKQYIFTGGFAGKVGTFDWNFDYTHGIAKLDTDLNNDINRQNLAHALDAVTNAAGQIVCNVTITNPGLANDCVPINVFGPSAASAAAIDYVTDTVNYKATTKQDDVAAGISGSPFSTWAGEVTTALSGEWRKTSFSSRATSTPANQVNCTGVRFTNCTAGAALNDFQFGQSPTPVSQTVWEIAGEFDAPLLKESFLGEGVNLNGAVRYTHYNTSGNYWTWKLGLDWKLADALRFRGTLSRDIRAPTLYDLFAPTSSVPVRPTDLLTGLSPTVPSINPSNPNLTAEIGKALTAGIVWKPAYGLSVAVDVYRIKVTNAITQIDGSTTAFQNACYASGGTSPYCALQLRPNGFTDRSAANAVTAWLVQNVNISEIETTGMDVEANYNSTLFSRPLSVRALLAWQPHIYYRQPNVVTIDQGGAAFGPTGLGATPRYRFTGYLRFQPVENFTVDIQERWRSSMKLGGDPSQVWVNNHIDSFATTNLTLSWDVNPSFAKVQLFANVQNLFDATPPVGAYSGNGTRAGLRDGYALGDDPRGRSFTGGVRVRF